MPDLAVQARNDRAADKQFAAANAQLRVPERTHQLPAPVRLQRGHEAPRARAPGPGRAPVTLNNQTYEGRPVEGIEIATNPNARDGRPVFLQMGVHHAREWPSAEHAMEWAYELILGYRRGDARVRDLVSKTRTIVVPVVNPDGFNASREAGEMFGNGSGHETDVDGNGEVDDPEFLLAAATHPNEYRRKNCRFPGDPPMGNCAGVDAGAAGHGVDPNRNYGAFWGGGGSSGDFYTQTYRGPEPFSEPESQNIRELVSARQVTTLITNHTFSGLVLRPPGIAAQGTTVDEPIYKALGDSMAAENGYSSQYGYQLYDTDGTTEDWSYNATGGLGFTYEIGHLGFHPPFEATVKEWNGTTDYATGDGNRAAYYKAQANTADASKHSVLDRPRSGRGDPAADEDVRHADLAGGPDVHGPPELDDPGSLERDLRVAREPVDAPARGEGERPAADRRAERAAGVRVAWRHDAVRELRHPAAGLLRGPPDHGPERRRHRQREGDLQDRVRAAERLRHEGLQGRLGRERDRRRRDHLGPRRHGRRARLRGGVDHRSGRLVRRARAELRGRRPVDRHRTFEGPGTYTAPLEETWTLSCETPEGVTRSARQVFVARGERRSLDLRGDCRVRR